MKDWIIPAKPTAIIKFPDDVEAGTPEFLVKEFKNVIDRGNAQDIPVFIVSITGVLRSGKSFILNLMKTYLDYYHFVSHRTLLVLGLLVSVLVLISTSASTSTDTSTTIVLIVLLPLCKL